VLSEKQREKSGKTKARIAALKKKLRIPTLSVLVRHNCIECSGGSYKVADECATVCCPLWPYRLGRSPNEERLKVPIFDKKGDIIDYREYEGYEEESIYIRNKA